jgi:flagellin
MSLSIRTNVGSLNAQNNLNKTQSLLDSSMSKLSSGMRITKAGDDAAGLGISVNLEAQIRSYNQAARNANDGLSMIQTAEAALNSTTNILTRLRELAMQAASDGVGATDRVNIQAEVTQLVSELDRNATAAEYNGTKLLNTNATSLDFQIGIRNVAGNDRISVSTVNVTASTLGIANLGGFGVTTSNFADATNGKVNAQNALTTLDSALNSISANRATFGAVGNRFDSVIQNIQTFAEQLSAANSRIRDVDVAQETSNLSRAQILAQAGVSVLGQANQLPQMALKLLG